MEIKDVEILGLRTLALARRSVEPQNWITGPGEPFCQIWQLLVQLFEHGGKGAAKFAPFETPLLVLFVYIWMGSTGLT